MRQPWRSFVVMISLAIPLISGSAASASGHAHGPDDSDDLHFSHPLVSESPSPDTKIRFDGHFARENQEEDLDRYTLVAEGEFAFRRWGSIEVDVPYVFVDRGDAPSHRNLADVAVALKLASFALEEHGLLLGGGLELGLPTGDSDEEIGSSHVVGIEPFLDFGWMVDRLETIGFLKFGVPTNENGEDEVDLEIGWNLAFLVHVLPRLEALLEFDGENAIGGEEDGRWVVNISPGLKFAPFESRRLKIGVGVSLPLTPDEEFDVRTGISVFYHF